LNGAPITPARRLVKEKKESGVLELTKDLSARHSNLLLAEGFYLLPDFRVMSFCEPTRQGVHIGNPNPGPAD
jgi:hypothetical protein